MTKIDKNLIVGIATNKDMKYGALVLSHMSFEEMKKSHAMNAFWVTSFWEDKADAPISEILKEYNLTLTDNYFIHRGAKYVEVGRGIISRFYYTRIVEVEKASTT